MIKVLLLLFLLLPLGGFCCDYGKLDSIDITDYLDADAIFIGKVVSVSQVDGGECIKVLFDVSAWYKGESKAEQATIYADDKSFFRSCLLHNSRCLVYAYGPNFRLRTFYGTRTCAESYLDTGKERNLADIYPAGYCYYSSMTSGVNSHFSADVAFLERLLSMAKIDGSRSFVGFRGAGIVTGSFKKGKPDGAWLFSTGSMVIERRNYQEGKKDGYWTHYAGEGSNADTITQYYIDGEEVYFGSPGYWPGKDYKYDRISIDPGTGKFVCRSYYPDGQLRRLSYRTGPSSCCEGASFTYKEKLDGLSISYYPDGKKSFEGNYYKGKMTGEWKYYDEDGSVRIKKYESTADIDKEGEL